MAKARKKPDPAVVAALQTRLDADVRKQLAPLRKRCATKLAKLTAKPAPDGSDRLLFEVSDYHDQFSVVVFAENELPGGEELVKLLDSVESPAFPDAEAAEYTAAGIDPTGAVRAGVVEMLADAWASAGGLDYPLPTALRYHDGGEYDLEHRRWVE